jgi:beta-lactamase class A
VARSVQASGRDAVAWLVGALVVLLALTPALPTHADGRGPRQGSRPAGRLADVPLQELLERTLRGESARFGVVVQHLETGEAAAVRADRRYETASLYKLAVLQEVYRQHQHGELPWNSVLTVSERHLGLELVSPWAYAGRTISVADATSLMITLSDNTAGALLWTRVGQTRINQGLTEIGLVDTRLDWESYTTPADMARFFLLAYRGDLVDQESSAEMLDLLSRQQINDRLPRLLPRNTRVAHKTGELPGLTHDVGVIYAPTGPFVLAVLTEWGTSGAPSAAIARLARQIYDYFEERYGELADGP